MTMMPWSTDGMMVPSPRFADLSRSLAALGGSQTAPSPTARRAGVAAAGISAEQRLVQRATMGLSQTALQRFQQLGYDGWLEEQLDFESLDDSELEDVLAETLPSLAMTPYEIDQQYQENPFQPIVELWVAAIARAIYSPRQLFERMVIFWTDHFNISIYADFQNVLKPTDDRDVIRRHALGKFPELLSESAHSAAMLFYLNNNTNVKQHPNENYARELMELHSMGAGRGYTEGDVKEVSRCLTGWTIAGRDLGTQAGTFRYEPFVHDDGAKVVLGQQIPAGGGIRDGELVLEMLAENPKTAHFIARKMLIAFWGYRPTGAMVSAVARRYLATGGDIREMLRVVLREGRLANAPDKLKRPFHLLVSGIRALEPEIQNWGFLIESLQVMGHIPFGWGPPDGYPDEAGYWSGFVLPRWNLANAMPKRARSGLIVRRNDLFNPSLGTTKIVENIDWILTNSTLGSTARSELRGFLDQGRATRGRVNQTLGLALASPEFQHY